MDEVTPLHYACGGGHLPIIEYLISKGADIKYPDYFGDYGIHYAIQYDHLPVVQYLIEKQNVDIEIKGQYERTPLHNACMYLSIADYLISHGANIESKDEYGNTPLSYASDYWKTYIVKYLVSCGADKKF